MVRVFLTGGDAVTPAVIWDGIAGAGLSAIVGGAVSALVALWVVRLTQRGAKAEALASESRAAAGQLTVALIELRHNAGTLDELPDRGDRKDRRRSLATDAAQAFNLHRPALQEKSLRDDAERAQKVIVTFLSLSRERDNGRNWMPRAMRLSGFPPPPDPWHRNAHRVLGAYLSLFTDRLAEHRLGGRVSTDPIPEPEWPPITWEGHPSPE